MYSRLFMFFVHCRTSIVRVHYILQNWVCILIVHRGFLFEGCVLMRQPMSPIMSCVIHSISVQRPARHHRLRFHLTSIKSQNTMTRASSLAPYSICAWLDLISIQHLVHSFNQVTQSNTWCIASGCDRSQDEWRIGILPWQCLEHTYHRSLQKCLTVRPMRWNTVQLKGRLKSCVVKTARTVQMTQSEDDQEICSRSQSWPKPASTDDMNSRKNSTDDMNSKRAKIVVASHKASRRPAEGKQRLYFASS